MPSSTSPNGLAEPQNKDMLPPPIGDAQTAEKYVKWIIDLISQNRLIVTHSDLSKYQPSCLEDHYRVPLKDYEVEVSHSKHPDTSADLFVMLFNNVKFIADNKTEKVILAFIYLTKEQFLQFKEVADAQIEQIKKMAEERRFKQAMVPIDQLLEERGSRPDASLVQDEAERVLDQAETEAEAAASNQATEETPPPPEEPVETPPQAAPPPPTAEDEAPAPELQATPYDSTPNPEEAEAEPPASDLPPVPPTSLPPSAPTSTTAQVAEPPTVQEAPAVESPDHQSQLAEVAALAAPTPETNSQNVYLTGDLGYQIPEAPAVATTATPEPTPPVTPTPTPTPTTPESVPSFTPAPAPGSDQVVQSQSSSSLFEGGQNENNLFINPASLNPPDIKPLNPIPTS